MTLASELWRTHRADALLATCARFFACRSHQAVMATLADQLVVDFGYRAAVVRLLNPESQLLELRAASGLSAAVLSRYRKQIALDPQLAAGHSISVINASYSAGFQYQADVAQAGLASILRIPLLDGDHPLGVLSVYTAVPRHFSSDEQALLMALGHIGGQAILHTQRDDAVATLLQQLSAPLDLSEIISTVLTHAVEVLPVAAGILRLLGPSGAAVSTVAGYGLGPSPLDTGMVPVPQAPLDQSVLTTRQPRTLTESDPNADEIFPAAARREGFRSVLAVPLATSQAIVGVLHLYSNGLRRFYREEIACIEDVAALGASALAQAKHYEALKVYVDVCRETHRSWAKPLPG